MKNHMVLCELIHRAKANRVNLKTALSKIETMENNLAELWCSMLNDNVC